MMKKASFVDMYREEVSPLCTHLSLESEVKSFDVHFICEDEVLHP